jgi:hypothetical protein
MDAIQLKDGTSVKMEEIATAVYFKVGAHKRRGFGFASLPDESLSPIQHACWCICEAEKPYTWRGRQRRSNLF